MATNKTQSGSSGYLPEDLIREILPRLPPRNLLRCRTVCKAWHLLATDRDIILNHHARQPAQPLLTVFLFVAPHNCCLEAVDLSTNKLRMVARFVERAPLPFSDDAATNLAYDPRDALMVHASCDGLLLLSFHEASFVCNPATRQGALLPLRDGRDIAGFYKHAASGKYRVLYHQLEGVQRKYYVLTLGFQEARTVELHASSAAVGAWLARGLPGSYRWPPVLLHDCLHWPLQQSQDSNILVFDPAAESFSLVAPPPTAEMIQYDSYYDTRLFEMEGTLAMFCWRYKDARIADLWFLEDYEEANWVRKHRVELPVNLVYEPLPFYPAIAYPEEGDMLVPEGCDKAFLKAVEPANPSRPMATNKTQCCSSCHLPEELIREILSRLPPKGFLRCRTVCKAWRGLTTDRQLILEHHIRQPAQPLLTVFPFVAPHNNCLEAIDLSTNKLHMIARFVEKEPRHFSNDDDFDTLYRIRAALRVYASCDGLLLLSFHENFFVCNPATRQGTRLPRCCDDQGIAGFYKHAATGEYRVLYHQLEGLQRKYCVLTLGSQEGRTVDLGASSSAVVAGLARGLAGSYTKPPVLLHGCLHWPPQQRQYRNILVFDPAAESFSWVAPPPAAVMIQYENYDTRLFEMEGTLAMFCWRYKDARMADLWFLEDYEEANWVRKHRVELPVNLVYEPLPFYPAIAYPEEGDMLVPEGCDTVLHFDKDGQLQGSFQCAVKGLRITPHMLKESLVIHEFLHTQQDGSAGDWFSEVQFAADGLPVTGLPS